MRAIENTLLIIVGILIGIIMHSFMYCNGEITMLERNVLALEVQQDTLIDTLAEKHREVHDLNQMINRFIEADDGYVFHISEGDE